MSALAPTMQAFFTERLLTQRRASVNTVASYRDAFRLLLAFAQRRTGKTPSKLQLEDIDAELIGAFLEHLEADRHNSVATRNNRLAAVHSLFAYAALRHPEHAELVQRVLAIPNKRTDRQLVCFLTAEEVDALLAAPDRDTWFGRRDHALLLVAVQTGLRVSELTSLVGADVELGTGADLRCHGKGRKERITPLTTEACAVLRVWMAERRGARAIRSFRAAEAEPSAATPSPSPSPATPGPPSAAVRPWRPRPWRPMSYATRAQCGCSPPGWTPSVIALWLGHESVETTQIYLHADLAIKERALARTAPAGTTPGRYRPPDTLLAFLEAL